MSQVCPICYHKKFLIKSCPIHKICSRCRKILQKNDKDSNFLPRNCWCEERVHKYFAQMKCTSLTSQVYEWAQRTQVNVKRCPRCTVVIEKKDGCQHMICLCGYHFCWNCGKKLDPALENQKHRCGSKIWDKKNMKYVKNDHDDIWIAICIIIFALIPLFLVFFHSFFKLDDLLWG